MDEIKSWTTKTSAVPISPDSFIPSKVPRITRTFSFLYSPTCPWESDAKPDFDSFRYTHHMTISLADKFLLPIFLAIGNLLPLIRFVPFCMPEIAVDEDCYLLPRQGDARLPGQFAIILPVAKAETPERFPKQDLRFCVFTPYVCHVAASMCIHHIIHFQADAERDIFSIC